MSFWRSLLAALGLGGAAKAAPVAPGLAPFKHLQIGARYRVIRAFTDFDKAEHPVGETWWFLGHSFLPYEDGLSLFVSPEGVSRRQIRLQWRAEEQGALIDALEDHIAPAPEPPGAARGGL